jgi:DNA-binding IclR family transcriptional regulator
MPVHAPSLVRNQSLQRAARLLWTLAEHPEGSSAADLARATLIPAPTTGRLLATLADLGIADRLPDDVTWVLGRDLVRLARAADPYRSFLQTARPSLVRLALAAGESADICLVHLPHDIEVIAQADAPTMLGGRNWLGQRFDILASSAGKIALASLLPDDAVLGIARRTPPKPYASKTITDPDAICADIARSRRRGWAEAIDELEEGLSTVAVLLRVEDQESCLTLAVSGPTSRLGSRRRRDLVPLLREHAAELAALLG